MKPGRYTSKEVKRAREAREMINNAGFLSEAEALGLVNDGNLTGVQLTARDIKRCFDISGVRARRTQHKAVTQRVDRDLKSDFGEMQTMYGDVAYFNQKPYVMCITESLGLVTATSVINTKALTLGAAIQTHVSTIQSRGFLPTIIHLDPEKGFAALDPHIPGVEVDICGAGDDTNPIDLIIRHVKEIFRSVRDSLPWDQPWWLDKDMVTYSTCRKNLRSTPHSNVSARVKFIGRKPVFKKELGLAYGDYCECYNPAVVSRGSSPRTEPCVALYPTTNANGSWVFLNLTSKRRVR
jgi:hypothetical protein